MPHPSSALLLETIDHAYAAIDDPARWPLALEALASCLDARAAGIRIETLGRAPSLAQTWVGLDASFDRAYVEEYWKHDPWAAPVLRSPVGHAAHGDAITPRRIVEASAFHNDLALPNGFDDLAGAILERNVARVVSIGVMKGRGRKRFTATSTALLERVVPHFQRAFNLGERLAGRANVRAGADVERRVGDELAARFRLTPAETRVALRVGRGLSPKQAATELGVSWFTIRAQLRQVFAKTETQNQRALTRLVTLLEASLST